MPMIEDSLDDYRRHLVMYGTGVRDDCPQCKMVYPIHKMDCSVQYQAAFFCRRAYENESVSTKTR